VTIKRSNSVTVEDKRPGIPTDMAREEKKSALEVVTYRTFMLKAKFDKVISKFQAVLRVSDSFLLCECTFPRIWKARCLEMGNHY